MPLVLSKLYFDHHKLVDNRKPPESGPRTSALHIRRNQDFETPWPEYDAKAVSGQSESMLAYSMMDTASQDVFVLAEFEEPSKVHATYDVRAEEGGILGEIDPTTIRFDPGETSTYKIIPLRKRVFEEIGKYDITWQWYYRVNGERGWKSLATTHHKVFLVYSTPERQWSQDAFRKNNPWTELLDICCEIAQGARDDIIAVAELTRAINDRYDLRYDIIAGAPRYTFSIYKNDMAITEFDLVNWINFVLKGNPPANLAYLPGTVETDEHYRIVGCQDTAAALTVMASVIGTKAEMVFHAHFGYLKYILPIGRDKSNNPYTYLNPTAPSESIKGEDDERTKFQFHYYVKLRGNNFDCCMRSCSNELEEAGWLINLPQKDYEEKTIDRNTPQKRELNYVQSADGTWHPSIPEPTDLEILQA